MKYFFKTVDEIQELGNPTLDPEKADKDHIPEGVYSRGSDIFANYNLEHMPENAILPNLNSIMDDLNNDGELTSTYLTLLALAQRSQLISS